MKQSHTVIKNSVWLVAQPLALNVISIAVVGYIARSLGQADYGKFIFAFAFTALFTPIANMGLRPVTVRELAGNRDKTPAFLGRMAVLRLFLGLAAAVLAAAVVNVMHYPDTTKYAVYAASLILLLQALTTTFTDVFQAYEEMRYVARVQFVSGLALTALSAAAVYAGYGLMGVMVVYCLGNLLGMLIAAACLYGKFAVPAYSVDLAFWKEHLVKGIPFILPGLIALIGARAGIILLSKMSGDASVGVYGAANNLVEKLVIIPDGVCTAIFPTLVSAYQQSKQDAVLLYKKFYSYLFLAGLPIALGTTILAKPIIGLIYGPGYAHSVVILQILVWWLFVTFLASIEGWTLGAIHRERDGARVSYIATALYVVLSVIGIPYLGETGVALASLAAGAVTLVLLGRYVKRHLAVGSVLSGEELTKYLLANTIMGAVVFLLRERHPGISVVSGMLTYLAAVMALRIIVPQDFGKLFALFALKKNAAGA